MAKRKAETVMVRGKVTSPVVRRGSVREVEMTERVQEYAEKGYLEVLPTLEEVPEPQETVEEPQNSTSDEG